MKRSKSGFGAIPVALLFALLLSSCSLSGVRRIYFEDDQSRPVDQVLVVPLSSYQSWGKRKRVMRVPFVCDSGDNLMKDHLQTKGAVVGPGLFVGSDASVSDWLFLKEGYVPTLVSNGAIERMTGANRIAREDQRERRAIPVDQAVSETGVELQAVRLRSARSDAFANAMHAMLNSQNDSSAARELLGGDFEIGNDVRRVLGDYSE